MNRPVTYPSGFKCRKWTLVALISLDLLVLILTTVAVVMRSTGEDASGMEPRNITASRIPSLTQITNTAKDIGENLNKLNITKINVNLGALENNKTREFLDNILNKARENEDQTALIGQIVAIVLGFLICLIGLVGVIREHYCLTCTYACVTLVGLLFTVIVAIFARSPEMSGKIVMYVLFLILVVWYIMDLRSVRRQLKSQNI